MKNKEVIFSMLLLLQCQVIFAQSDLSDRVSLHGYMDMLLLKGDVEPVGDFALITTHRVNLMPHFIISPKFSATLLLEGADLFRLDQPVVQDKPGIMEWAYLTYNHNENLNVRAGAFAVPFGIYNERFYATPTQLTSFLPTSYNRHNYGSGDSSFTQFMFPRNPSGLMLFGKMFNNTKNHFKYYIYYTNESPVGNALLNKYLGGRVMYETASSDALKVGISYNSYLISNELVNSVFGFDIQWRVNNFKLSTELVLPKIGKRDGSSMPIIGQYYNGLGTYVQVGYTIKDVVTPYFRYDHFNGSKHSEGDGISTIISGVNISIHPQVIFKAEAYVTENENPETTDSKFFIATLAVAF